MDHDNSELGTLNSELKTMIRSFSAAMRFINRFTDYERMTGVRLTPRAYNLDRTRALLKALGNPERGFMSVHIAGTKGKGSTAHMTETILRTAGKKTGLFTSPHLVDMLERVQIGGRPVSERDFTWAVRRMEPAARRLRPTYFEIMTAAAFLLFKRARVDVAVVEVGLGGRLDSTNVICPAACAVTTIDYDHTDILGKTLGKIAREKAGILKPGVPAVTTERKREPRRVIEREARRVRAPLWRLGREIRIGHVRAAFLGRKPMLKCRLTLRGGASLGVRLPVLGAHQAENAAAAAALAILVGVSPRMIERAFPRVRLPARLEIVGRRPWIVVDTAHNPVSIRATARAVSRPRGGRLVLVFGTSRDKDVSEMARVLAPAADLAILTRSQSPRACPPEEMANCWGNRPAVTVGSVARAVALARKIARPRDAILVTGSFYVAGEALRVLREGVRS